MTKLLIATLFFSSSLFAATCVPQSGSAKNVQDLNDRACATEQFVVGTGGVTANTLVITDTSSPAKVIAATGSGAYGIALSTVAATGTVNVQRYGQVACVMDNNATAGDLVIPGTSTVIDCRDSGQTASAAIPMTTRIIGVLMTSASSGATAIVELSPAHFGTQTSGGIPVCADATGSTTTYTCPSAALSSLAVNTEILFVPQASSSGASTVNVAGLGAKAIVWPQSAAATIQDDLLAGGKYLFVYDGTNWRIVNGPDGTWQSLPYDNGWADFGSGLQVGQYMKDRMGIVHIRGLLSPGTNVGGTTIFTLPAGYRSTGAPLMFGFENNTGIIRLDVSSAGTFAIDVPLAGGYLTVEGITFATH